MADPACVVCGVAYERVSQKPRCVCFPHTQSKANIELHAVQPPVVHNGLLQLRQQLQVKVFQALRLINRKRRTELQRQFEQVMAISIDGFANEIAILVPMVYTFARVANSDFRSTFLQIFQEYIRALAVCEEKASGNASNQVANIMKLMNEVIDEDEQPGSDKKSKSSRRRSRRKKLKEANEFYQDFIIDNTERTPQKHGIEVGQQMQRLQQAVGEDGTYPSQ